MDQMMIAIDLASELNALSAAATSFGALWQTASGLLCFSLLGLEWRLVARRAR